MSSQDLTTPIWVPSAERIAASNMTAFMQQAGKRWNRCFDDYASLHRWSVEYPQEFWVSVWELGEVRGEMGRRVVVDGNSMPGAKWFPEARLNFSQNLLRSRDGGLALTFWGEDKLIQHLSRSEIYHSVASLAASMREDGIKAGDVIAAYMPNMPETIIAMLAAASIGAVFTSASPDFGVQGILDRFGQIEPKLLFTVDGYYYNGKTIDLLDKVAEIAGKLPSVKHTVVSSYVRAENIDLSKVQDGTMWNTYIKANRRATWIDFEQLPFDHPLYIMYTSGTTGVPKCIVHCAGGVLLQHLKEHKLHGDVKPGDKLFYFTTCGWMMWNWLATGLASDATLMLYDGSPFIDSGNILFDYAETESITHFGTSAKFIDACTKVELKPRATHNLRTLRTIFSTGSPLVPEGFDYVYAHIKEDVQLASISGGTDIISCFVGGNPIGPVWRGEIQCAGLGMATDVVDENGQSVWEEKGELVCTKPFPVMPLRFWNDENRHKYHSAYFARFPGIWCHGDFAERTTHDGFVIYGRSDATLNPGGVRIGTAEIYRQVEKLPEVIEALVIGQDWENDVRVVLFVKLKNDLMLDDILVKRIKDTIRESTTPRHVPAKVVQVLDIPRTKSGKIVELAVRNVVHGQHVKNLEALANPEALEFFRNRVELGN